MVSEEAENRQPWLLTFDSQIFFRFRDPKDKKATSADTLAASNGLRGRELTASKRKERLLLVENQRRVTRAARAFAVHNGSQHLTVAGE